jgi:hypothetical protein
MHVRIRAHATSGAGAANEDIAGAARRFAWIVDGASGVGTRNLTSGKTDAAWLAASIDEAIRVRVSQDGDVTLDRLIRDLESDLARRFAREIGDTRNVAGDAPSACLAVVECGAADDGHARIRGAVIGDVCVFVPDPHGLQRWTDERLKPFEARTLQALGRHRRSSDLVPAAVLDQIRANRRWLNREGGYYAVHPVLPWAGRMLGFEATIAADRALLLATDGFLRLSDLFARFDDRELHAAVIRGETAALIETLRDLERADPFGERYPRVKTHDDATVLAVAPEPARAHMSDRS